MNAAPRSGILSAEVRRVKETAAAWTMVGAVIGAGFASGREIASFFSRWGWWSLAAIAAAVGILIRICRDAMERPCPPLSWREKWPEKLWQGMFLALLIVTGGAMTAAAGEIAALTLPIRGAYWLGMLVSLVLAQILCEKTTTGLTRISQALTACLILIMMMGLFLPPMRGVALKGTQGWQALPQSLWHGLCYGGFNGALAVPVLTQMRTHMQHEQHRRAVWLGCGILAALLLLGNAVMLRHPALMGEVLPMIRLLERFGRTGYMMGALALWLSAMSTLMACLAGMRGRGWWPALAMAVVAMLGFSAAVERLYPLLGGGCAALLAAARWEK